MRVIFFLMVTSLLHGCVEKGGVKESSIPQKQIAAFKTEARMALPPGEAKELVIANCIHCHSYKLIVQNSATRSGWKNMIIWMQETQGLWPLGASEDQIIDYLARHFAPVHVGRRAPLVVKEWYELE